MPQYTIRVGEKWRPHTITESAGAALDDEITVTVGDAESVEDGVEVTEIAVADTVMDAESVGVVVAST